MYIYDSISLNSSEDEKYFRSILQRKLNTEFTFSNYFFLIRAVQEIMWKILYSRASHGWQCTAFHALCILDNYGYRRTLRICNTHCFSTVTMITRMRFCVRRTLPVLLCQSSSIWPTTARWRRQGTWWYGLSALTTYIFVTPHIKCIIFLNFDIILAARNIQPYSVFSQIKIPKVKLEGNTVKYFF
jgi:hypothetical protein